MESKMETDWTGDFNYELENDVDSSALSLYNLFDVNEFKVAYLTGDKKKVDELLYTVGVDLDEGWCVVNRLHRPLGSNEVVQGGVLLYKERVDPEWTKGEYVSMEALIRGTRDPSVRSEMMIMQDAYLSTGKVLDKCKSLQK